MIVAGAQAIDLHTGMNDIGIAPYTTDGDIAVGPTILGDEPELEATMRAATSHRRAGHDERHHAAGRAVRVPAR